MDIVVLAGGLSPERDVSLSSGCLIANALADNGHRALLVDLYMQAPAASFADAYARRLESPYAAADGSYRFSVPAREPDLGALVASNGGRAGHVGPGVYELCASADATFLGLHGSVGENGQLQAALDLHGVRYTGTGYAGSLLAMDKAVSKELFRFNGVLTPDWVACDFSEGGAAPGAPGTGGRSPSSSGISPSTPSSSGRSPSAQSSGGRSSNSSGLSRADFVAKVADEIGFPCVLKPNSCGSSVGVSIVRGHAELEDALALALRYSQSVVVEKYIFGREISVGVLGGDALPPIEIIPREGFYDYKNKYQQGLTEEICPARVTAAFARRLQDEALAAHRALRLGSYSRLDFIAEALPAGQPAGQPAAQPAGQPAAQPAEQPAGQPAAQPAPEYGNIYCLEANTLPGMTPTSLLPQMALAVGISYNVLCEKIVSLA